MDTMKDMEDTYKNLTGGNWVASETSRPNANQSDTNDVIGHFAGAGADGTEFGLSAGICTTSLKYADSFRRQAQVGMVMVKLPTADVDQHVPFGGRKGSFFGVLERGCYAVEFYTVVKTSYISAG